MRHSIRVMPAHVKAEASRRILDRFPLWKQLNIQADGGDPQAEMTEFISRIRSRSNEIEHLSPIPADFANDRYWS